MAVVSGIAFADGDLAGSIGGMAIGAIPGASLFVLSLISKGKLGMGDALMVLVMGLFIGLRQTVGELMMAVVFAGIFALVLVAAKKCRKGDELPFVPFLAAAHILELCILRQVIP